MPLVIKCLKGRQADTHTHMRTQANTYTDTLTHTDFPYKSNIKKPDERQPVAGACLVSKTTFSSKFYENKIIYHSVYHNIFAISWM